MLLGSLDNGFVRLIAYNRFDFAFDVGSLGGVGQHFKDGVGTGFRGLVESSEPSVGIRICLNMTMGSMTTANSVNHKATRQRQASH